MTLGQKDGGLYLSPWNHDKWLSPQMIHQFEWGFSFGYIKQERKGTVVWKPQEITFPKMLTYHNALWL